MFKYIGFMEYGKHNVIITSQTHFLSAFSTKEQNDNNSSECFVSSDNNYLISCIGNRIGEIKHNRNNVLFFMPINNSQIGLQTNCYSNSWFKDLTQYEYDAFKQCVHEYNEYFSKIENKDKKVLQFDKPIVNIKLDVIRQQVNRFIVDKFSSQFDNVAYFKEVKDDLVLTSDVIKLVNFWNKHCKTDKNCYTVDGTVFVPQDNNESCFQIDKINIETVYKYTIIKK